MSILFQPDCYNACDLKASGLNVTANEAKAAGNFVLLLWFFLKENPTFHLIYCSYYGTNIAIWSISKSWMCKVSKALYMWISVCDFFSF